MKNKLIEIFPFNLSFELFGDWNEAQEIHIDNFLKELDSLEERDSKALRMRYEEDMTLKEIASEIGVSLNTVSAIIAKAKRKLRHPVRRNRYSTVSREEFIKIKNECGKLVWELTSLKNAFEELSEGDSDIETIRRISDYRELMERSIDDLHIPLRNKTSLRRNGINKLRDLKNCTFNDLKKVSNIGAKSAQEIVDQLEKLGIKIKE